MRESLRVGRVDLGEAGKREAQEMRDAVRFCTSAGRQWEGLWEGLRTTALTMWVKDRGTPSEMMVRAMSEGSASVGAGASPLATRARPVTNKSSATSDFSPAPPSEMNLALGVWEMLCAAAKRVEDWMMAVT